MKSVDGILKVFEKTITQLDAAAIAQNKQVEKLDLVIAETQIDRVIAEGEALRAAKVAHKLRDIVSV